jgi:RNA polymerase sigma-70 factor (ECF subfamily)
MTPSEHCDRLSSLLKEHGAALALFAAQWSDHPDDCVQEALIALAGQRDWPENPGAWMYRVVRRKAIDELRRRRRRTQHEAIAARLRGESDQANDSANRAAEEAAEALTRLDDEARELVIARLWGRLTFDELAHAFEISSSAAQRRYAAAIESLRAAERNRT